MKKIVYWCFMIPSCSSKQEKTPALQTDEKASTRTRLIIDIDANNELDDQHGLAYALANQEIFQIEGITINNTSMAVAFNKEAIIDDIFNALDNYKK